MICRRNWHPCHDSQTLRTGGKVCRNYRSVRQLAKLLPPPSCLPSTLSANPLSNISSSWPLREPPLTFCKRIMDYNIVFNSSNFHVETFQKRPRDQAFCLHIFDFLDLHDPYQQMGYVLFYYVKPPNLP